MKPYKISTAFIKAQTPGLTINQLTRFYYAELEKQNVSSIITASGAHTLDFTNDNLKLVFNRYANKFSCFSKGRIEIVDEGTEFAIYLNADTRRIFVNAAIYGAVSQLLMLILVRFELFLLFIGPAFFAAGIISQLIWLSGFFPVYFIRLRNDIERVLQRGW